MSSPYLRNLSHQQRGALITNLHESYGGNCFICGKPISLELHADTIDIDHIQPTQGGVRTVQRISV